MGQRGPSKIYCLAVTLKSPKPADASLKRDISLVQVSFGKSLHHIMWIFITVNYCSKILRALQQGWLKF